ncbi:MAG: DEAD/DEAH box helicase [Nocardioidaceae bacterium]
MTHVERLPGVPGESLPWPGWVPQELRDAWLAQGIDRPWVHQVQAAEAARAGQHVVIATGTASGKSLGYLMPALTSIVTKRQRDRGRGSTTLYLAPTKALANDQATAVRALGVPGLALATHDGDSPREQRYWTRDHAEYVLTNPDMLHRSLLPTHERWARFFALLDYVVIDEAHHYRGVFGAHVAQIVRRLRRVCARYGSSPTFVLASATVADPVPAAHRLLGLDAVAVTDDRSRRGPVSVVLWEPPFTRGLGEHDAPVRRAAAAETADLLADLVVEGLRTLAFVRSRQGAESVALQAKRLLNEVNPDLANRVAAYRGGYLPEERRDVEAAMRRGDLLGLAATNALELGIDVAGLDAVVLAGFPGTRASFWQQIGRAGRAGQEALGVLVARDDPMDTYLVHHPDALLGAPVEASVFDPDNPYVLGPHLCAAAHELPLTEADFGLFGPNAAAGVAALEQAGMLRRRATGWYWTDRSRASDLADIRSSGGSPVRLVEAVTGRMLGTVDAGAAHGTVHAGAIYTHQGETYLVLELDLEEGVAVVEAAEPTYFTTAREITDIAILSETRAAAWGPARLCLGEVRVTHQVTSFLKRRVPSGEVLGTELLDLPERMLDTVAVWWTISPAVIEDAGFHEAELPGAAHAAEHAAIGLLPLFATCDRWDIGGVSTAVHPDTGQLTVFVYDGHPGGAGFAERGYERARAWLTATRDAIADCTCLDGCPSCVQSPKCGNGNSPLDKAAAVRLLDLLLASS